MKNSRRSPPARFLAGTLMDGMRESPAPIRPLSVVSDSAKQPVATVRSASIGLIGARLRRDRLRSAKTEQWRYRKDRLVAAVRGLRYTPAGSRTKVRATFD